MAPSARNQTVKEAPGKTVGCPKPVGPAHNKDSEDTRSMPSTEFMEKVRTPALTRFFLTWSVQTRHPALPAACKPARVWRLRETRSSCQCRESALGTKKLMQKRNGNKSQKKIRPLLPDFSAIPAISAILTPKFVPPYKFCTTLVLRTETLVRALQRRLSPHVSSSRKSRELVFRQL